MRRYIKILTTCNKIIIERLIKILFFSFETTLRNGGVCWNPLNCSNDWYRSMVLSDSLLRNIRMLILQEKSWFIYFHCWTLKVWRIAAVVDQVWRVHGGPRFQQCQSSTSTPKMIVSTTTHYFLSTNRNSDPRKIIVFLGRWQRLFLCLSFISFIRESSYFSLGTT